MRFVERLWSVAFSFRVISKCCCSIKRVANTITRYLLPAFDGSSCIQVDSLRLVLTKINSFSKQIHEKIIHERTSSFLAFPSGDVFVVENQHLHPASFSRRGDDSVRSAGPHSRAHVCLHADRLSGQHHVSGTEVKVLNASGWL